MLNKKLIHNISITDEVIKKISELVKEKQNNTLFLRIYIIGGGCAGFQYGFSLDKKYNNDDIIINKDGINIVIDSMSIKYLIGSTIDYVDNLKGNHFIVKNPNAHTSCGCGSSFSV